MEGEHAVSTTGYCVQGALCKLSITLCDKYMLIEFFVLQVLALFLLIAHLKVFQDGRQIQLVTMLMTAGQFFSCRL